MAAHIPKDELYIVVVNLLGVKSNRWNALNYLTKLKLVKHGCLASTIKPQQEHTTLDWISSKHGSNRVLFEPACKAFNSLRVDVGDLVGNFDLHNLNVLKPSSFRLKLVLNSLNCVLIHNLKTGFNLLHIL